jgi:hypothetical protein
MSVVPKEHAFEPGMPDSTDILSLTILIPTIRNRHEWLARCLDGLSHAPDHPEVEVIVSGNGTGEATRAECDARGVHLIERAEVLSASDHGAGLLPVGRGRWVWIVPDDDIPAAGALESILRMLSIHDPDVIVGRTRRFTRDDLSDLSVPVPPQRPAYMATSTAEAAQKTSLRVDLGAFVYRRSLITPTMYRRYQGTSHDIFGALWDGIAASERACVAICPDVLVYARQSVKAHDESAWRTWLGMLYMAERLPPDAREVGLAAASALVSWRPALRAVGEGQHPRSDELPVEVWQRVPLWRRITFEAATRCPAVLARAGLGLRTAVPLLSRARGARIDKHTTHTQDD